MSSSLPGGVTPPYCNPDVRKSVGCTTDIPRDIAFDLGDILILYAFFWLACVWNRNFLLCLDQTATDKMTVSTVGSFHGFGEKTSLTL